MPRARRWPSRSSRARRPTCSSPPISTGWTTSPSKKLIKDDTRVNLLGNKLVLIAPKDSKIDNVDDRPGLRPRQARRRRPHRHRRRASAVPVGKYAKAALEKLGAWAAAEPKLAMAENVRAALALVARGEAPLGIVYETDAKVEPNVKIVGTSRTTRIRRSSIRWRLTADAKPEAAKYLALPALAARRRRSSRSMASRFLIKPAS